MQIINAFNKKHQPVYFGYQINNTVVNRFGTGKDLGVIFDCELSFRKHIATSYRSIENEWIPYQKLNFVDIKA